MFFKKKTPTKAINSQESVARCDVDLMKKRINEMEEGVKFAYSALKKANEQIEITNYTFENHLKALDELSNSVGLLINSTDEFHLWGKKGLTNFANKINERMNYYVCLPNTDAHPIYNIYSAVYKIMDVDILNWDTGFRISMDNAQIFLNDYCDLTVEQKKDAVRCVRTYYSHSGKVTELGNMAIECFNLEQFGKLSNLTKVVCDYVKTLHENYDVINREVGGAFDELLVCNEKTGADAVAEWGNNLSALKEKMYYIRDFKSPKMFKIPQSLLTL